MIGVLISTFFICLSTVMVNLSSGSYNPTISATEMSEGATIMTQAGFAAGFGSFGGMFLSICLSFFSLTTIVGWYFFAESNVKMVINSKPITINAFKAAVITALVVGTMIDAKFVWELADMFMGIMAVPNVIALFLLSKEVKEILDDYDSCVKIGNIHWEYKCQNLDNKKIKRNRRAILRKGISTTILK